MMYVFAIISLGLFVIAGVSSVLFWFVGMYHFVAMISNKRWEARGKWWSSGFMTIYIPSALTEAGRMHRRRGFLSFAGFFASLAVGCAVFFGSQLIKTWLFAS
jgi:hypothetical protein